MKEGNKLKQGLVIKTWRIQSFEHLTQLCSIHPLENVKSIAQLQTYKDMAICINWQARKEEQ